MSDTISKSDSDSQHPADAGQAAVAGKAPKRRHPIRRAVIVGVIGLGLIAAMQWFAPETDHQIANMVTVAVGFLTSLYVIFRIHEICRLSGHRLLIPLTCLISIGAFFSAFEFVGFSGELWPQFKLRAGGKAPLETKLLGSTEIETGDIPQETAASVAASPSTGFLGSELTGVITERLFSVPKNFAEIETLWNHGIGEGWSSFAVSGDKAVTLEQRDDLECVTCYRLSDGELLWMESHEARHQNFLGGIGPRSTPTIDGERVYAQGATGRVWCLQLDSGEVNWSVDLLELAGWTKLESEGLIAWGRAGSPLLIDESSETSEKLCVLPYGGPPQNAATGRSLIALDAQTGDVKWTAGKEQISFASPALMTLAGVRQIVSVNEDTVTGHAIADGKVLWSLQWLGKSNGDANCAMAVPAGEDRFLIGKGYGGGSALVEIQAGDSSMTAKAVWSLQRVLKTKFTHACVDGDVAYAVSNGSLEAVRVSDGEVLWQQPRGSRFKQGQILLVDDIIVAVSEEGEVVLVAADPDEYRELLRFAALDSKTWNVPTVAGRHLLVRNDRQAICYLLPAREK